MSGTVYLDTVAPVISNVQLIHASGSGVTVTWNTDEPSDSQVEYGTSVLYGSLTGLDSILTLAHLESVSGLTHDVQYHLRVGWRDAAGNLAVSQDYTYTPTLQVEVYSTSGNYVKARKWDLISVPADPVNPDPLAVFSALDPANSSLQFWINSGGGWQHYGDIWGWTGPVVRGTPYWMLPRSIASDMDISFTGVVPSEDFVLSIAGQGAPAFWIMFGSPLPAQLDADSIMFRDPSRSGGTWCNWSDAYGGTISSNRPPSVGTMRPNALERRPYLMHGRSLSLFQPMVGLLAARTR